MVTVGIVAIFHPFPSDSINPGWDFAMEILSYRHREGKSVEVEYRDLQGRVHRTSTRYMKVY